VCAFSFWTQNRYSLLTNDKYGFLADFVEHPMRFKVMVCLVAALSFLLGSINETRASSVGSVSFRGAGVIVDMEFPEEAHPTETITLNVTITALLALKLQNFTLVIKVLVDTGWQQVYKEQLLSLNMDPSEVLVRLVWFTLPQSAHESLYCEMYVLTDKAPGLPPTYIFYATHVRTVTYDELLANYSSLLTDYETLLNYYNGLVAQYNGLNSTYNSLLGQYNSLSATFESLNSSYFAQKAAYDALRADYVSLETSYKTLNQTHHALTIENVDLRNTIGARDTELTTTRNVAYGLIAVTVALAALVIYNKKKRSEPYVVLRKETVTLKPA
jgi:hypothetical protein